MINDYDQFSAPALTESQLYLKVINESTGTLLYDSQDKEGSVSGRDIDPQQYDYDYRINLETFTYTVPTGGDHTIKAIIGRDPGAESLGLVEGLLLRLFLGFGAGFMTLIILIGLFTWYISRSILKPLNELNAAAEHITQGNLDYTITVRQQDELGRFCHTFNVMQDNSIFIPHWYVMVQNIFYVLLQIIIYIGLMSLSYCRVTTVGQGYEDFVNP